MKLFTSSTQTVIDPVCGMRVDPCRTDLFADHNDSRFYFCAEGCRKAFEQNPETYANTTPAAHNGWWGRYLARLNKATDGKAIKCH